MEQSARLIEAARPTHFRLLDFAREHHRRPSHFGHFTKSQYIAFDLLEELKASITVSRPWGIILVRFSSFSE